MKNLFLKVHEFISSASYSRTLTVLGVLVILIAIPLTVKVAQEQQDIRQRADTNSCIDQCSADREACRGYCQNPASGCSVTSCDNPYNTCINNCTNPVTTQCTSQGGTCLGSQENCPSGTTEGGQRDCSNTARCCMPAAAATPTPTPRSCECINGSYGPDYGVCGSLYGQTCSRPEPTAVPTTPPGGGGGGATCTPLSPDFLRNECTGCNTSNSVCQNSAGVFRTTPNSNDTACASLCSSQPTATPIPPPPPGGGEGAGIACQDNQSVTTDPPAPAGYSWKAKCNISCAVVVNPPECPKNTWDPSNVNPNSSTWCYGFQGGAKCLQLVRNACQTPGAPGCLANTPTPTAGPGACTIGNQTPNLAAACISCITTQESGLVNSLKGLNPTLFNSCSNQQLINYWCNGGISTEATTQCNTLKSGACAASCGGATPTAPPAPGDKVFVFNLTLGAISSGRTVSTPERQLTVELLDNTGAITSTKTGPVTYQSSTGKFTGSINMGNITAGNYQVKVKAGRYLKKRIPGITSIEATTTQVTMPETTLIVGDMNNDNKVDIADYNMLLSCFGNKADSPTCGGKQNTDLDDNNTIDEIDFNILIRSLAIQSGD